MSTTEVGIRVDNRPSDHEYAILSHHVYGTEGQDPIEGSILKTPFNTWRILRTRATGGCGYFGAIYYSESSGQLVLSHRGTNNLVDFFENFIGVLLNQRDTPQRIAANQLVEETLALTSEINLKSQGQGGGSNVQVSFTGHSLGGFLAELSVFHAITALGQQDVSAVTFESPGSGSAIEELERSAESTRPRLNPRKLDITSYLCYPNLVNTCNRHFGTLYFINVDLGEWGGWPLYYLFKCHTIDGILSWFQAWEGDSSTSSTRSRTYMSDWPVGLSQKATYFKYATFLNGLYRLVPGLGPGYDPTRRDQCLYQTLKNLLYGNEPVDLEPQLKKLRKLFKLRFRGGFKMEPELIGSHVLSLHHFQVPLQTFLVTFHSGLCDWLWKMSTHRSFEITVLKKLLKLKWEGLRDPMPRTLRQNLVEMTIRRNHLDLLELRIREGASAPKFRSDLSRWLAQTGYSVETLIPGCCP